jgi:hypothetical protein
MEAALDLDAVRDVVGHASLSDVVLLHVAWGSHHPGRVSEVVLDGATHARYRAGEELDAARGVELLGGAHEGQRGDLLEILPEPRPAGVSPGNGACDVEIAQHEGVDDAAAIGVARLLGGQCRVAGAAFRGAHPCLLRGGCRQG